jgi:hypothetical protein
MRHQSTTLRFCAVVLRESNNPNQKFQRAQPDNR